MKKKLTPDQEHALQLLTDKGAGMTAAATRDTWEKGETYYLDTRNPARGDSRVLRAFNKGNKDAVKVQPREHYKSTNGAQENRASCKTKPGAVHSEECTGKSHVLSVAEDPARAKAYADLHHYAELVLADLNDRKTGWYYQFSAAVEKVRNHFPPTV